MEYVLQIGLTPFTSDNSDERTDSALYSSDITGLPVNGVGEFSVSGGSVSINRGYSLTGSTGGHVLSGMSLTYFRAYIFAIGISTFSIDNSLVSSDSTTITSDLSAEDTDGEGSFTIPPGVAILNIGTFHNSNTGSFSLSSNPVTFHKAFIHDGDSGQYLISVRGVEIGRDYIFNVGSRYLSADNTEDSSDTESLTADGTQTSSGDIPIFEISGHGVEVISSLSHPVSRGAYGITGHPVNFVLFKVFAASSSSYVITPNEGILSKALSMSVSDGSFSTWAGPITYELGFNPGVVLFGLSGGAANFEIGGTVFSGSFQLSGNPALGILALHESLDAGVFSLSLFGLSVVKALSTQSGAGAFTVSGAASLTQYLGFGVLNGSYSATFNDLSGLKSIHFGVSAGEFLLSLKPVFMPYGRLSLFDSGEYFLSNNDAEFLLGLGTAVGSGILNLSGESVTFCRSYIFHVGRWAVSFADSSEETADSEIPTADSDLLGDDGIFSHQLTGYPVESILTFTFNVATGSFELSGYAVQIELSFPALSGEFALSGIDISSSKALNLALLSGDFHAVALPAGFVIVDEFSVVSGSFDLALTTATFEAKLLMPVGSGEFILQSPGVIIGTFLTMELMVGEFFLSAHGGSIGIYYGFGIGSGDFAITGAGTSLEKSLSLQPDGGMFLLAGSPIGTTKHLIFEVGNGGFSIVPGELVFQKSMSMEAGPSVLDLFGYHVSFTSHISFMASSGDLSISGEAELLKSLQTAISVGEYRYDGGVILSNVYQIFIPGKGHFVVDSYESLFVHLIHIYGNGYEGEFVDQLRRYEKITGLSGFSHLITGEGGFQSLITGDGGFRSLITGESGFEDEISGNSDFESVIHNLSKIL